MNCAPPLPSLQPAPADTSYTYDAADRLTNTARPNGLASDRTYDNADRLLSVLNRNGGTPISSFTYTLDNVGNRTQVADTSGTTTYGYDDLYRLTATAYPNGDTQAYTYDAMGNRLTMVNNGATTTYGYDNADRLTQLNGVNNSLDDNGNLLALGVGTNLANTFQFDQEDRVHRAGPCRSDINGDGISNSIDGLIIAARYGSHGSTVFDLLADLNNDSKINTADAQIQAGEFGKQCKNTGPNTGNERAWFNGDGLRVGERTFPFPQASVTRDFTWDVGASLPVILQETRTQGGVPATVSYVYGLDLISVTDSAAGTAYLLNDGHGSTSELTDSAGAVTNTYTYDVFGALRSSSGTTANDFRYTGQQQDANANRGMYYLRARTYDPQLGRFLQKDRLPLLQRYAYVGNNPATFADPSGMSCEGGVGISFFGGFGSVEGMGASTGLCAGGGGGAAVAAGAAVTAACIATDCAQRVTDLFRSVYDEAIRALGKSRAQQRNQGRSGDVSRQLGHPQPPRMPNPDDPSRFPGLGCPPSHPVACRSLLALIFAAYPLHELHLDEALIDLFKVGKEGR